MKPSKRLALWLLVVFAVGALTLGRLLHHGPATEQAQRPTEPPLVRSGETAASPQAFLSARPDPEAILDVVRRSYGGDRTDPRPRELDLALQRHLSESELLLARLKDTEAVQVAPILSLLESKRQELEVVQKEAVRWLEEHAGGNTALQRGIEERFATVRAALQGVEESSAGASRSQAVGAAMQTLSAANPPRIGTRGAPQPTLRRVEPVTSVPDTLPTAPAPAYVRQGPPTAASREQDIPPTRVDAAEARLAASSGKFLDLVGIPEARAAEPPAAPLPGAEACRFTADDLGDGLPEVEVDDPRIAALAAQLHYSPLEIYAYVKNTIVFQPYYGSWKGAGATLASGAGNDTDQASLLIALLRASKVPARYVKGIVRMPQDDPRLSNWLGVRTGSGAAYRFVYNGRWAEIGGGYVRFPHVWAEACVPYDNYRGSGTDSSGHRWIPLDASFKEMVYRDGDTVPADFSFDYDGYLAHRTTVMPHEALQRQLDAHLGRALQGIGYQGEIIPKQVDVLPATPPFEVSEYIAWSGTGASEAAALPSAHRRYVTYEIQTQDGQPLVPKLQLAMPELATRRLTLSFQGATASDQSKLASWTQGNSAMPCGAAGVYPVFRLEGADVTPAGARVSVDICTDRNRLKITVPKLGEAVEEWNRSPTPLNEVQYTNIGAHNYHALQAYAFQASDAVLEQRSAELLATVGANPDPSSLQDEILGEYLHIVGLKYMNYLVRSSLVVGRLFDETGDGGPHIGLTSTAMQVHYLFDLPFAVSGDGLLVDVPGGLSTSSDLNGGGGSFETFLLSGYAASAYESYIWQEHAHLDAVSTVRGLQFANDTGVGVVTLAGIADIDAKLNQGCATAPYDMRYSSGLKDALRDLFAQGFSKFTLPKCLILYNDWQGYVWTAERNDSSRYAASYAIGGDYVAGGGYTTGQPITDTYNPVLNTGYQDTLSASIVNDIFRDTVVNVDLRPADLGLGSNTGKTALTSQSGDPVNLVSGNMFHQERDIRLRGRGGLEIVFERFYNSNARKDGPLGFGWTHSFNHYLRFFDESGDGKTSQVVWVDGTAATNHFSVPGTAGGVAAGQVLTAQPGLYVEAKREANGEYSVREKNGLTFYFEGVSGMPGQQARLLRFTDRNGNTLSLSYDSSGRLETVRDDPGRELRLYYDEGDQHITRIADWSGRTFRYGYVDDNLVQFEPPLAVEGTQAPVTYAYYTAGDGTNLDHAMKSFTYPNGNGMRFEYYTNGKVFRHTDSLGQTFTFRYNKFRRETTTVDERGVTNVYLFNERGQQIEHIRGDGSRMTYEYADPANPLYETSRRNPLGYETTFAYDADGNLMETRLPDGSTLQYRSYNAFHQPSKVKDGNGNVTLYRYDERGNRTDTIVLRRGVDNDAPTPQQILAWTVTTYEDHGSVQSTKRVRDYATKAGPSTGFLYDTLGLNPAEVKRCGRQQNGGTLATRCISGSQTFDELGRVTLAVDDAFYTSQFEYDLNGRAVRATDATHRWRDLAYDDNGNPVAESLLGMSSAGEVKLLVHDAVQYDPLGRPVLTSNVAGFSTRTEYDAAGNVIRITDPDGYAVRFEYDALNRPIRAYDEQGHAVETEYDSGGRPVRVTDPNGNSTTYSYYGLEENGRLRTVTSADGRYLEYHYDDNGNVVRTVDNGGRESLTEYDALNRPVRAVGPVHHAHGLPDIRQVSLLKYDELGDVSEVWAGYTGAGATSTDDNLVLQAAYVYDDFGRPVEETDARGATNRRTYDAHGNLVRTEAANGHVVELHYDHERNGLLHQRVVRLTAADASPQITTWYYDDLGQTTRVDGPESSYSYRYDRAGRLVQAVDSRAGKSLYYDSSPGGLLNYISDSEGRRTDFLYDAAGRLTSILAPNGDRVSFVFDPGGRLREKHLPNGISSRYGYDAGDKLIQLTNRTATQVISQHVYDYDELGRRTSHVETIAGASTTYGYEYDALDRLLNVKEDGLLAETYTYDPFDNRRTLEPSGAPIRYYQYDAAQQLTQIREGSHTGPAMAGFVYDATGNLVKRCEGGAVTRTDVGCDGASTLSLAYDALERLVRAEKSGQPAETYRYDHEGRRIEKASGSSVRRYLYSGMDIWAEYGSDWSQALAYYTYTGLDEPVIRSASAPEQTLYYHQDGLGSTVAVTDYAGTIRGSRRYDAWGNVISSTGSIPVFGYTGREPDGTGLIYYRARYYNPTVGRFTQRDPAGLLDGINRYVYVGQSPVNFVDPLGLGKQAATVTQSMDSRYPGSRPATRGTDGGFIDYGTVCPNCHDTVPNDATTTAADRAFVQDLAAKGVLAIGAIGLEIATGPYPAIGTVAAITASGGDMPMGARGTFRPSAQLVARRTVGELRAAGQRDAHHVIQDAAVRDLPRYNTNEAPGVHLPGPANVPATPHYNATQVQRQAGGGTYASERRIGYKALRRAGLSRGQARGAIQHADEYFERIGVGPDALTRIPGNRP